MSDQTPRCPRCGNDDVVLQDLTVHWWPAMTWTWDGEEWQIEDWGAHDYDDEGQNTDEIQPMRCDHTERTPADEHGPFMFSCCGWQGQIADLLPPREGAAA